MVAHQNRKTERNQLSANALIQIVRKGFEAISDRRPPGTIISLTDVLMSALAVVYTWIVVPSKCLFGDFDRMYKAVRQTLVIAARPKQSRGSEKPWFPFTPRTNLHAGK